MIPQIIGTGLVTADMIRKGDIFLFEVQKTEVEESNYARITQLIGELNKCKKHGRGKIGLSFAYDGDTRELCEIKEVVSYVKRLFEMCPYLVYFLLPDQDALRTYLFCLSDAKVDSKSGGMAHMNVDKDVFFGKVKDIVYSMKSYGASVNDLDGANALLNELGY